jgi:CelD/BcsL family acetyltransferase involved in cellulose biosynthesis
MPGSYPLVLDPVTDPRWGEALRASDATVFHHPAWLRALRDEYRHPIWAICLEDDEGRVVAGLPVATVVSRLTGNRLVALPFSDVCPPILSGDASRLAPLVEALEQERARRGLPLEVHAQLEGLPSCSQGDEFLHQTAALPKDVAGVDRLLSAKKRRAVRRAVRDGVEVERRTDRAAIDAFFALHVRTRRKHGVPTQPRSFFRRLEALFQQDLGFLLLAVHGGQPIAAAVYLRFNGVMTLKYSASDERRLKLRGNTLIYDRALRIAVEEHCQRFDFGRTELENEGLRYFKEEFGAETRSLTYTLAPARRGARSVRSVSSLQKTVIRRSPALLGRVAGAVLYRHYA